MSPKLYNSLSEATRPPSRGGEGRRRAQRKKVNDDREPGIAQLRSDGMTVVTEVDGKRLRTAMTPVWADSPPSTRDNIRRIQEFK